MNDLYREIRSDLQEVADYLEDNQITYWSYNHGTQFKAYDKDGIIHSFYPTTGTILLHKTNEKSSNQSVTLRRKTKEEFQMLLQHPDQIQAYFK